MPLLKIATWNVNSIAARLPHVLRWLEMHQPDVLCLQEIKCIDGKFPLSDFVAAGYHSLVFGQPSYNGMATLVRAELSASVSRLQKGFPEDLEDAPRRLLAANIAGVEVVNVYIPNGQAVGSEKYAYKLDWLARLRAYLDTSQVSSGPVILCGDFNIAPDPIDVYDSQAWEGKILFSLPEKAALQNIKEWGFEDTFRQLYPEKVAYSWWDYRQASFRRNLGLRIDHLWATVSLLPTCQEVAIDSEPRSWERPSDHAPVFAVFNI